MFWMLWILDALKGLLENVDVFLLTIIKELGMKSLMFVGWSTVSL